jgi:hypothetical protein
VSVRSYAFAAATVTSEDPVVIYTCPAENVAAVKGIGLGILNPSVDDDTPSGCVFYMRSGDASNYLLIALQAFEDGVPESDIFEVWVVLNPGDSISALSSDGQPWSVSLFGALLAPYGE